LRLHWVISVFIADCGLNGKNSDERQAQSDFMAVGKLFSVLSLICLSLYIGVIRETYLPAGRQVRG